MQWVYVGDQHRIGSSGSDGAGVPHNPTSNIIPVTVGFSTALEDDSLNSNVSHTFFFFCDTPPTISNLLVSIYFIFLCKKKKVS